MQSIPVPRPSTPTRCRSFGQNHLLAASDDTFSYALAEIHGRIQKMSAGGARGGGGPDSSAFCYLAINVFVFVPPLRCNWTLGGGGRRRGLYQNFFKEIYNHL